MDWPWSENYASQRRRIWSSDQTNYAVVNSEVDAGSRDALSSAARIVRRGDKSRSRFRFRRSEAPRAEGCVLNATLTSSGDVTIRLIRRWSRAKWAAGWLCPASIFLGVVQHPPAADSRSSPGRGSHAKSADLRCSLLYDADTIAGASGHRGRGGIERPACRPIGRVKYMEVRA